MALRPGIPALLLLTILTVVAFGIGSIRLGGIFRFVVHASTTERAMTSLFLATPFWVWAVINSATSGNFDLGAVTFLLVILSCAGLLLQKKKQLWKTILLSISSALVSVNYLLPFFMNLDLEYTYYVYFGVGVLFWAGMCLWSWLGRQHESTTPTDSNESESTTLK